MTQIPEWNSNSREIDRSPQTYSYPLRTTELPHLLTGDKVTQMPLAELFSKRAREIHFKDEKDTDVTMTFRNWEKPVADDQKTKYVFTFSLTEEQYNTYCLSEQNKTSFAPPKYTAEPVSSDGTGKHGYNITMWLDETNFFSVKVIKAA